MSIEELKKILRERKQFLERKLESKEKPHFYGVNPNIINETGAKIEEVERTLNLIENLKKVDMIEHLEDREIAQGSAIAKTHELKILPKYFREVADGYKNFELRKNDRDYKVGDLLMLKEFMDGEYTGDSIQVVITYILAGGEYGLDKDYVILGIE